MYKTLYNSLKTGLYTLGCIYPRCGYSHDTQLIEKRLDNTSFKHQNCKENVFSTYINVFKICVNIMIRTSIRNG